MNIEICQKLIDLLLKNNLTISTCESASCGELASMLGSVSGVSKTFKGGFVVYTNEAKNKLLKIPMETINEFGAVSEQIARLMALNTNKILKTDISISITGNCGPEPMENKPVSFYYVGICIIDVCDVIEVQLPAYERNMNRTCITIHVINELYNRLKNMTSK